ncbi:hypothetical protein ACT7DH_06650 [Bacillus pacificus]
MQKKKFSVHIWAQCLTMVDEVIERNKSQFGLAAGVWTEMLNSTLRCK